MKVKFIIPGDVIRLTKPGTLQATLEAAATNNYNYQLEEVVHSGVTELPAGTVLLASQIYIRKGGFFENSITFKVKTPAFLALLLSARIMKELEDFTHQRDMWKASLAFINSFSKDGKSPVIVVQQFDSKDYEEKNPLKTEVFFEGEAPAGCSDDLWKWYNQKYKASNLGGLVEMFSVFRNPCQCQHPRYHGHFRTHIEQNISNMEALIADLNNPKSGLCKRLKSSIEKTVFRFRLTDIEQWDITVVEHDEKAAKAPF